MSSPLAFDVEEEAELGALGVDSGPPNPATPAATNPATPGIPATPAAASSPAPSRGLGCRPGASEAGGGRGGGGKRGSQSSAGASAGGASASAGAHKPTGNKRLQCKGCLKFFSAEQMPSGCSFCRPDKRALDNIYNAAKRQKKTEWWNVVRYNDEKRVQLLSRYHAMHPELREGENKRGARGNTFDIAQYMEETRVSSEVLRDTIKRPMSRADFETQAMSDPNIRAVHGVFLSAAAAGQYWLQLSQETEAVVGKNKAGDATVEVEVDSHTIYRNSFSQSKTVSTKDKERRKPTQGDMDALLRKGTVGMEDMGLASTNSSLVDVAKAMAASCAEPGEAFHGAHMTIGDVDHLLDLDEMGTEDQGGLSGARSFEAGGEVEDFMAAAASGVDPGPLQAAAPPAKKAGRWFDNDRAVASAVRQQAAWAHSMHAKLEDQARTAKRIQDQIEALHFQHELRNESAILETRRKAILCVTAPVETADAALMAFLASFDGAGTENTWPKKMSDAASSITTRTLGSKPPCENYSKLVTIAAFHRKLNAFHDCESKGQIKDMVEALKEPKGAITELSSMANLVIKDCEKAIKAVQLSKKRAASGVDPGRTGAKKSKSAGATAISLHEMVISAGFDPLPTAGVDAASSNKEAQTALGVDPGLPALLSLAAAHPLLAAANQARVHAEPLLRDLKAAHAKQTAGKQASRVSRIIEAGSPAHTAAAAGGISSLLPQVIPLGTDAAETPKALEWSVFCIVRDLTTCTHEKDFVGCYRLSFQGTRQVIIVDMRSLTGYLQKRAELSAGAVDPSKLWPIVRDATPLTLSAMCKGEVRMWHGTVAPGDVLFLPSCCVVHETVRGESEVTGLRCPLLKASDAESFEWLMSNFQTETKDTATLEQLIKIAKPSPQGKPPKPDTPEKKTDTETAAEEQTKEDKVEE